jgi:uncharacterized protein YndB with AHSA1/START domain
MTASKSFKRLVRTRMEKTGESYTAARAALLDATEPARAAVPTLTMSDAAVTRRTGRGWEEWFDLLDSADAFALDHPGLVAWLGENTDVDGWSAQAIAVNYERARGGRRVGERADGFQVTASKTVGVPVDELYDAFTDPARRARWAPDAPLRERTATRPKGARYDWEDGTTRVVVGFEAKDDSRSTVALAHERIASAEEADRLKDYWRARVAALKAELEGAGG